MEKFDITAIVNLHAEGALAYASLKSLFRAKALAESAGLRVETLAVMDRASNDTLDVVKPYDAEGLRSLRVEHADLGLARNSGVEAAQGKWIAFLDGDDLWGANWLAAAYREAEKDARSVVWHPAANIYFGTQQYLFMHLDMEDEDFDVLNLSFSNCWTALSFAKRELYLSIPYRASNLECQVGYEDWSWHQETISRGYLHKCVSGTVHAIRSRAQSLLHETTKRNALPAPTALYRELISRTHRHAQKGSP